MVEEMKANWQRQQSWPRSRSFLAREEPEERVALSFGSFSHPPLRGVVEVRTSGK